MKNKEDGVYRLTPKGYIAMMADDDINDLGKSWAALRLFVEKQAKANGHIEGIPCLIFDEDGGTCGLIEMLDLEP